MEKAMVSERRPLDSKTLINGGMKQSAVESTQSAFLKKHPSVGSAGRFLESLSSVSPSLMGMIASTGTLKGSEVLQ